MHLNTNVKSKRLVFRNTQKVISGSMDGDNNTEQGGGNTMDRSSDDDGDFVSHQEEKHTKHNDAQMTGSKTVLVQLGLIS